MGKEGRKGAIVQQSVTTEKRSEKDGIGAEEMRLIGEESETDSKKG